MHLIISEETQRQYKRLPKHQQQKIRKKLTALSVSPYSGKKLEGKLKGRYSIRVWPYRIIYSINKSKNRLEVSAILHRQEAYKN